MTDEPITERHLLNLIDQLRMGIKYIHQDIADHYQEQVDQERRDKARVEARLAEVTAERDKLLGVIHDNVIGY
jgi:hypothetical protein